MKRLVGKVALITGGSQGIGKGVAMALAREGAKIAIAARNSALIEQAKNDLRVTGVDVLGLAVDVADPSQVDRLVHDIIIQFGGIDVLVNAAGIQGPIGPLWLADPEQWRTAMNINLFGTMLCCRAVVPHMIESGGGKIINFSGGGATEPRPNFSSYAAAKAAVVRLTETLAEEVRRFGINVNAIAPGVVDTKLLQGIVQAGAAAGAEKARVEALRKEPAGFVAVEVAAGLVLFLVCPESDGLTGRLISAPYDDWKNWNKTRIRQLCSLPWLTLRRIDQHTLSPFIRSHVRD